MSGCAPVEQTGFAEKGWQPASRYSAGSAAAASAVGGAEPAFATRLAQVAPAWDPARRAVLRAAARTPGVAVTVLTLYHAARHRPGLRFAEDQKPGAVVLFRSRVTYVSDDEMASVTGPWRTTKRDALQVLADLAGLPVEVPPPRQAESPAPASATQAPNPQERLATLQEAGVISNLTFKEQPSITGLEPLFVCVAVCLCNGQVLSGTGRSVGRSGAGSEAANKLLSEWKRVTAPAVPMWPGQQNPPAVSEMNALRPCPTWSV